MHHGFYNAYHNTTIRPGILNAVARAKEFYGDIGIIVTGHSMGGAMASFCALDLRVIITKPVSFLLVSCHKFFSFSSSFSFHSSMHDVFRFCITIDWGMGSILVSFLEGECTGFHVSLLE